MRPDRAMLNCPGTDQVSQPQDVSSAGAVNLVLASRSDTEALGKTIGDALAGGEILALIGDLGVGKTTLIRGIAAGLGVPPDAVSSPTFVLIHEYSGRLPLIHVDLYRLRTGAETQSIGLEDYLTGRTITAVEWADRFPALLPEDRLEVRLSHRSLTTRRARLVAHGPQSHALLTRIKLAKDANRRRSTVLRQTNRSGRRKARRR
ncbi:MAG: tRNA (adenosine(37)-N6)-threonylcarbamoyltransferase complex ATPase subunit type 1 TsaE [Nitrospiraceae bacterium]